MIKINVSSAGFEAGDFAKITINDIPVKVLKNPDNHYRGLHLVVINQADGSTVLA